MVTSIGKTNKRKGFDAERLYANRFREMGFSNCLTTRESSRLLDRCKVDLNFLPFMIQIKAGIQRNLNFSKTLLEMDENLLQHFPITHEYFSFPHIVIHHKQGRKGVNRTEYDELVIMSFNTFKKLINEYKNNPNI